MTESIHSYGKILALGHKGLENLFKGPVLVEEKVDGSQFSFGLRNGELFFRSRGAAIYPETTDKLFKAAVDYVVSIKDSLKEGWTYRGEVLHAPRHNTLTYGRVPKHNLVLFDIERPMQQDYLNFSEKAMVAASLDLEVVPVFFEGEIKTVDQLQELLTKESFLGGCKLEGIVLKNYTQFGKDGKCLMGKWVREAFKEEHRTAWKVSNPTKGDVIEAIIKTYRHENRWEKAVQHLRDAGKLTNSPQDIGPLLKEAQDDIKAECAERIKEQLFELAWPKIARGSVAGLPEWWKKKLAESMFQEKESV